MCSNYRTDSPKTCSSILSSFSCKFRFLLSLLHVLIVYVKLIGNKRGKWKGKKEDDDDNEEEEQKQEREREQEQQIDLVLFHYVKKKHNNTNKAKRNIRKGMIFTQLRPLFSSFWILTNDYLQSIPLKLQSYTKSSYLWPILCRVVWFSNAKNESSKSSNR